jgi:phage gpG-like protein
MQAKFTNINRILSQIDGSYSVNVGIMGSKASKTHKDKKKKKTKLTNGELGAIHEFGSISRGIPARSFLRYPIQFHFPMWLRENKKSFIKYLIQGRYLQWLEIMGGAAENIVQNAFDTSGFGMWKPLKPATIKARKKSKIAGESALPLIDTSELRRSITSEVVRD